jgi:hypothetical protein
MTFMISWSGKGYMVPVVAVCCHFLMCFACKIVSGDVNYYGLHGWPMLMAFVLAAWFVWMLGKKFKGTTSYGLDSVTGERVAYIPRHTFCVLPMEYWAIPFILLGLCFGLLNPH